MVTTSREYNPACPYKTRLVGVSGRATLSFNDGPKNNHR